MISNHDRIWPSRDLYVGCPTQHICFVGRALLVNGCSKRGVGDTSSTNKVNADQFCTCLQVNTNR